MANTPAKHGGVRPKSGRKPQAPILCASPSLMTSEPKEFLTAAMNERTLDMRLRVDAAKALLRLDAAQGVKANRESSATKAATGRFKPTAPPLILLK